MMNNFTYRIRFEDSSNLSQSHAAEYEACLRNPYYRNVMITLFLAVIVLSGLGNILLWFGFITKKRLRTITVCYLISLSASDFITVATLGWMKLIYVIDFPVWHFGELGSNLLNAFWCFSLVTPFTHIVFIAIDRYRSVTSSTVYSKKKSWSSELIRIAIVWAYSVGIVLLFTFHFDTAPEDMYQWNVLLEWYYPFLAIHMILPLLVCTVLYILMVKHVQKHRASVRNHFGSSTLREFRVARSVAIIIGFLYFVWIPVIALECIYAMLAHTCLIAQLCTVSVWLTCTAGVINPIIFLARNRTFYNAICCCRKHHFTTINALISDIGLAYTKTVMSREKGKRYESQAERYADETNSTTDQQVFTTEPTCLPNPEVSPWYVTVTTDSAFVSD